MLVTQVNNVHYDSLRSLPELASLSTMFASNPIVPMLVLTPEKMAVAVAAESGVCALTQ